MAIIRLKEALDITLENLHGGLPKPFDIEFVTFDKRRKKGGEIISLSQVVRVNQKHDTKHNGTIGVKNPKNSYHPICIHTWLITKINGMEVAL